MASADKCALLYIFLSLPRMVAYRLFAAAEANPCMYGIYTRKASNTHTHTHTHKKQCFGGLDSFFFFAPFALLLPRWLSRRRHILSLRLFFSFSFSCVPFFLSFCWVRVKMFIPAFKMAILCSWNYGGAVELKREKRRKTERLRFISRTSHSHSYDLMSETGWWRLEIIIQAATNWDGDYRWRCQLKLRAPAVVGWLRVTDIYHLLSLSLSLSHD